MKAPNNVSLLSKKITLSIQIQSIVSTVTGRYFVCYMDMLISIKNVTITTR